MDANDALVVKVVQSPNAAQSASGVMEGMSPLAPNGVEGDKNTRSNPPKTIKQGQKRTLNTQDIMC
jgi:hypothetical protein